MTPAAVKLPLRIKLGNGFGSVAYGVKDNGFSTDCSSWNWPTTTGGDWSVA